MGIPHDRMIAVKNEKKYCLSRAAAPNCLIILCIAVFFSGCKNAGADAGGNPQASQTVSEAPVRGRFSLSDSYYITGDKDQQEIFRDLFTLLEIEGQTGADQFPVAQEIAMEYAREKEYGRLINFLNSWISEYP